jgi:mannose-6-phosphate isomerase-like protein (cupin superfamily)
MQILTGAGTHTAAGGAHWAEHLRAAGLSCGTYSLPRGAGDPQQPHTEDEVYVCTTGRATLVTPGGSAELSPGCAAFVPAGEEHRFTGVDEDFTVLVIFGPAEGTRA